MPTKILLINPPVPNNKVWIREGRCQQWDIWGAPFPPFSLAMISTQLVKIGCETIIIDSGPERKNIDQVLQEALLFDPQFVVMTTTSPTIETDLGWFAPRLKEALPKVKTIAIGVHVSALPEPVLKRYNALDYAVLGEPEVATKDLIENLAAGRPVEGVSGIAYRGSDNLVKRNRSAGFVEDIDTFGFPDWGKIHFSNYPMPIIERPFSMISFSRGCPFSCKYCATHTYNGKNLRKRSVDTLIEEIKYNLSLGVRDFLFWTELMTGDNVYLHKFLDAILKENLQKQIRWVCNSRVDGITKELAQKMKEAGCWQMCFGFEFGDDSILQLADKGGKASIAQGRIAANIVYEAGIAVDGHFIMGYPGETVKTMQATMDYACSLPLTFAHFYAAVPIPGAPIYQESIDKGWSNEGQWDILTMDKASMTTEHLNPGIVNQFIQKAYRRFYLNPKVVARIYRIPRNFKEFIAVAYMGIKFLSIFALSKKERDIFCCPNPSAASCKSPAEDPLVPAGSLPKK